MVFHPCLYINFIFEAWIYIYISIYWKDQKTKKKIKDKIVVNFTKKINNLDFENTSVTILPSWKYISLPNSTVPTIPKLNGVLTNAKHNDQTNTTWKIQNIVIPTKYNQQNKEKM